MVLFMDLCWLEGPARSKATSVLGAAPTSDTAAMFFFPWFGKMKDRRCPHSTGGRGAGKAGFGLSLRPKACIQRKPTTT